MIYIVNLLPREGATLPDGRAQRGPNALGDIARLLIGDGADPADQLLALRDGRPVLQGTIEAFAGRQWAGAETDPKFRKWRPHPHAQMPPRLVAWATENGFLLPACYPHTGGTSERRGGDMEPS